MADSYFSLCKVLGTLALFSRKSAFPSSASFRQKIPKTVVSLPGVGIYREHAPSLCSSSPCPFTLPEPSGPRPKRQPKRGGGLHPGTAPPGQRNSTSCHYYGTILIAVTKERYPKASKSTSCVTMNLHVLVRVRESDPLGGRWPRSKAAYSERAGLLGARQG